jgi:hypothetical protein
MQDRWKKFSGHAGAKENQTETAGPNRVALGRQAGTTPDLKAMGK